MLIRWSRTINLVGHADLEVIWTRHVADSLQLVPLLPMSPGTLTDLGSGGGFPGLVLAIATDWSANLIESDQRKAAFLREAGRETGAKITVYAKRIENAAVAPAPVITARALAPLDRLLALAAPKLQPDGLCLFPKGRNVENELTQARKQWHMQVRQVPSRTDSHAKILHITDIRRFAPEVPRS